MTKSLEQRLAIYYKELKKWQDSRPDPSHNYDMEAWLEEKPEKPQ